MMALRSKKPAKNSVQTEEEKEVFHFRLTTKQLAAIGALLVYFVTGNPWAQKAAKEVFGVSTPVGDVEEVKKLSEKNEARAEKSEVKVDKLGKQMGSIETKLNVLVVEVERIRMNQNRTAAEK